MAWVYYQPLEGQKPTINADCLIRAISKWQGKDYDPIVAWQRAVYFAARMSYEEHIFPPNKTACILNYFKHHNCEVQHMNARRTVGTIAKNNHEPALITTKDHIVFANNGNFYDSWDSGRTVVHDVIYLKDFDENTTKIWVTEK